MPIGKAHQCRERLVDDEDAEPFRLQSCKARWDWRGRTACVRASAPDLGTTHAGARYERHDRRAAGPRRGQLPVRQHVRPSAAALLRAARSDAGGRAAARAGEPPLAALLGLDPGRARQPGGRRRCSPATACRRGRSRSRSPMPGTSSATSSRSSATVAPSCSARWWAGTAVAATSSSRAPGGRRFSRGGDGRAALGPVLREYIVSEAMAALGVPTTRALAAVTTGETVLARDARCPARC